MYHVKNILLIGALSLAAVAGNAQSFKEWQDPEINAVNRAPMHANFFAYENKEAADAEVKEKSSN